MASTCSPLSDDLVVLRTITDAEGFSSSLANTRSLGRARWTVAADTPSIASIVFASSPS